ncbi:MAG: RNA polymerase subunit sigma-70, partial [Actinocrinis sp.]
MIERTPAAARQLASRARRRVKGRGPAAKSGDLARQRRVVDAYLAASREGDFDALLTLLDPDVVLRADRAVMGTAAPVELRGVSVVAKGAYAAAGRAAFTETALVDGVPGLVMAPRGWLAAVLAFTVVGDVITEIDVVADAERLRALRIAVFDD